MAVVVILHVVLGYALVHSLARKTVEVANAPLDTRIIEEARPRPDKPPPPPPPKFAPPPLPYIAPPEFQIASPPVAPPAIAAVRQVAPTEPVALPSRPAPPPEPAAKPRAPVRVGAVADARACEKPAYPPGSLRANETGVVLLSFLIDVDGRVLEGKIERSSGHHRLDSAALNALGLCRFKPATVDGKPERTWSRIAYEWKIE